MPNTDATPVRITHEDGTSREVPQYVASSLVQDGVIYWCETEGCAEYHLDALDPTFDASAAWATVDAAIAYIRKEQT